MKFDINSLKEGHWYRFQEFNGHWGFIQYLGRKGRDYLFKWYGVVEAPEYQNGNANGASISWIQGANFSESSEQEMVENRI